MEEPATFLQVALFRSPTVVKTVQAARCLLFKSVPARHPGTRPGSSRNSANQNLFLFSLLEFTETWEIKSAVFVSCLMQGEFGDRPFRQNADWLGGFYSDFFFDIVEMSFAGSLRRKDAHLPREFLSRFRVWNLIFFECLKWCTTLCEVWGIPAHHESCVKTCMMIGYNERFMEDFYRIDWIFLADNDRFVSGPFRSKSLDWTWNQKKWNLMWHF